MECRLVIQSLLLSSLLSLFWPPTILCADPLVTTCSQTANYTVNSPFEINLKDLLKSLPQNTSISGFFNGSLGDDPNDQVFVQAICRGDLTPNQCKLCIKNASLEILKQCKTMDAIIWMELCEVHYSYSLFFSSMTYAGRYVANEGKSKVDPAKSSSVLWRLMDTLSYEAAYNDSRHMFAVGKAKISSNNTLYGLVQCTRDISPDDCRSCLNSAFADLDGCCSALQGGMIVSNNCVMRFEMYRFYNITAVNEIFVKTGRRKNTLELIVEVGVPTLVLIVVLALWVPCHKMRKKAQQDEEISRSVIKSALSAPRDISFTEEGNVVSTDGLPFIDLATLKEATENFSASRMLGQGGFGAVYEGLLPDGTKIAVKRLARRSWQGIKEFKNEIILIANLQHKNLVKLLGCGIECQEKILVYEFMPKKSLNLYIFDAERRAQLNWEMRFSIINGIAKGLLYLHDGSRLRIIHRDLKPSNILLDEEMVAKISDFGIARIFGERQPGASTKRVVGTYGYMAPEYAMEGLFSVKSDVFSYGVIVLEIVSGKRSSKYLSEHSHTLPAYARKLWNEGKELDLVDSLLAEPYLVEEVLRCLLIALLCVQEDPAKRPAMEDVVSLLNGESLILPQPSSPAFSVRQVADYNQIMPVHSSAYDD